MYLEVTLLCNMACPHCCYNAQRDPRKLPSGAKPFMSIETFRAALQWAPRIRTPAGNCPRLNFGGGEPTVHPLLFQMLDEAVEFCDAHHLVRPWMVTNGKVKRYALRLAQMAADGKIQCGVSQDKWHLAIDPEVVAAFKAGPNSKSYKISRAVGDGRFIQRVTKPIRAGRAKWTMPTEPLRDTCNGSGRPWVTTNGDVLQCGCDDAPVVGNVHDTFFPMRGEWVCWCGRRATRKIQNPLDPVLHPGVVQEEIGA